MRNKGLLSRVLDRVAVAGLTLIVLGLVSVQLFDVAGMAAAFGPQDEPDGGFDLQTTSGIVAPVLEASLGDEGAGAEESCLLRASLWLAPIASLRGGFGLGWLESWSEPDLAAPFGARRELRLRLGGGLMAPLTPSMGLDLHAGA